MSAKKRTVRLVVVTSCVFGYLLSPYAYWLWLQRQLESGALPGRADSFIPIEFVLVWLLGIFAVVLVGCVLTIWKFVQPQRR